MRAQILAADLVLLRASASRASPTSGLAALALSSGWSAWQLGDAGKGAGLAPRKILLGARNRRPHRW
jgi:hypothetical protein